MGHYRKALICGISGQDGALLASLLLDRGYEVVGTSRGDDARLAGLAAVDRFNQVKIVSLDISEAGAVDRVIRSVRPTEVYNLAGQSSVALSFHQPVETFRGIALGTLNLLEAIRTVDPSVRLFNAGSGEVFGETHGLAATEATPFSPRSPYATAKAAAHWAVANYREAWGLHASTGVLFNHESALRSDRFVTRKIAAAAVRIARGSSERLTLGNLEVARDWGWAPEYVEAMQLMLSLDAPRDFVIATGTTIRLEEFVEAAFAGVGLQWREHVEFDSALKRPTDLAMVRADPSQAAELLNWRAKTRGLDVARRLIEAELAIGTKNGSAAETR